MGFRKLFFGLESGSQGWSTTWTRALRRGAAPVLAHCAAAGIAFHLFSIVGFPEETEAARPRDPGVHARPPCRARPPAQASTSTPSRSTSARTTATTRPLRHRSRRARSRVADSPLSPPAPGATTAGRFDEVVDALIAEFSGPLRTAFRRSRYTPVTCGRASRSTPSCTGSTTAPTPSATAAHSPTPGTPGRSRLESAGRHGLPGAGAGAPRPQPARRGRRPAGPGGGPGHGTRLRLRRRAGRLPLDRSGPRVPGPRERAADWGGGCTPGVRNGLAGAPVVGLAPAGASVSIDAGSIARPWRRSVPPRGDRQPGSWPVRGLRDNPSRRRHRAGPHRHPGRGRGPAQLALPVDLRRARASTWAAGDGLRGDGGHARACAEASGCLCGWRAAIASWRPSTSVADPACCASHDPSSRCGPVSGGAELTDLLSVNMSGCPAEIVHTDYTLPRPTSTGCFLAGSNGLASGNTYVEALTQRFANWSSVTGRRSGIASPRAATRDTSRLGLHVDDPECAALVKQVLAADVGIAVWDTTSDVGIPTFECVVAERGEGGHTMHSASGMGCHPKRAIASPHTVTEAAQSRVTIITGARDNIMRADYDRIREPSNAARARPRAGLRRLRPPLVRRGPRPGLGDRPGRTSPRCSAD